MGTTRPMASVYCSEKEGVTVSSVKIPNVFVAPIRPDLVRYIHTNMAKNKRQAYGVATNAGYQTSAESWGTGRAVSRIPRVPGGGTHRAGQAAFGNMCRGGGMFAPNKTWRRWHRKVNLTQKRHAVACAIAASGIPALVMARGHRVNEVPELPLVVADSLEQVKKTKQAVKIMKTLGMDEELQKVEDSKKIRAGRGKMRNRRFVMRKGPLIVYAEDNGLTKAFRNIPGVELCHVDNLNLLDVAPGGTLGRLIVWTKSAFQRLNCLYGSALGKGLSQEKRGYHLPRPMMTNADLGRIINSDEIQSVVRPMFKKCTKLAKTYNPLVNKECMFRINPAAAGYATVAKSAQTVNTKDYSRVIEKKRKRDSEKRATTKSSRQFIMEFKTSFDAKKVAETAKPTDDH